MDRLKHMKECLIACVENQISGNLHNVNTQELGAAIDMIKDLEEAIYYGTITEAMEEKEEHMEKKMYEQPQQYYSDKMYRSYNDGMSYKPGSMYASNGSNGQSGNSGGNGRSYYHDMPMMNGMERDHREGQSPMYRKMYMEAKEQGNNSKQMQELEAYMQELSNDIMGMINDASAEEKQVMRQKITTLASKIK